MMHLLRIVLEAHSDELNRHRRYELTVARDLLGDWLVLILFGRVGFSQRLIQFADPHDCKARRFALSRLRRRLSALSRIGCAYKVTWSEESPEARLIDWVPQGILAGLPPYTAIISSQLPVRGSPPLDGCGSLDRAA